MKRPSNLGRGALLTVDDQAELKYMPNIRLRGLEHLPVIFGSQAVRGKPGGRCGTLTPRQEPELA